MYAFWQPNRALADAARCSTALAPWARTPSIDLAMLFTLGAVAAIATSVAPGGLRIPGHAILRGAAPLILGMSLVPRRSAGTAVSIASAATFGAMRLAGFGLPNPAAAMGLLCLGPASDLAVAGSRGGLWLYLRFAVGGLAANLAAFAVRIATGPAAAANATRRTWAPGSGMGGGGGMGMGGGRGMGMGRGAGRSLHAEPIEAFWSTALLTFALCGALAGLLCAWLWFRARPPGDKSAAP